ncbi:MAG: hypothetical protein HC819_01640 [Cyclobacteriaceae bacterium]|nr:hypothetical protein [Cyclobacteriaceae bacterium]
MDFRPLLGLVAEINKLKSLLQSDSANTSYLNQIAINYLQMGNQPGAALYLHRSLAVEADNNIAKGLKEEYQL